MASSVSGWRGVEQHEHEIGDALEPVELRGGLHRPEPTASAGQVIAAAHPFDWHLHLFWLLALLGLVVGYLRATRQPGCATGHASSSSSSVASSSSLGALTWPLGDLASHWLLLALVLQRLLLTLAVPPLLVLGTPRPVIARLTRPAAVDAVLRVAVRPLPAVAIVTVVAVATLTVGAVSLAAHSVDRPGPHRAGRARLGLRAVGAGPDASSRGRSTSPPWGAAAT